MFDTVSLIWLMMQKMMKAAPGKYYGISGGE